MLEFQFGLLNELAFTIIQDLFRPTLQLNNKTKAVEEIDGRLKIKVAEDANGELGTFNGSQIIAQKIMLKLYTPEPV
jgi:hypothetical protein